jgi:23S rRNA (cytidine2498-2'-O)-methyltransferase
VLPNIPIGSLSFKETPHPPSRAYLKLWEAFTKIGQWPNVKSSVLELGSSPGGWTWVLAKQIGCQVTCLDKGDMDPRIVGLKNVTWHQQDAFTFLSKNLSEPFDWLLSDMACDPHKLLPLVQDWVTKKPFSRCICTIKLTNKIDNTNSLIQQFKDIPNSWVTHLNVNKHELTWIYLGKS